MTLYKNVDIKDLESILKKGILSLNESGNNNWDEGKRANNSKDVVYLFSPLTDENSFCKYGTALLEVKVLEHDVKENILEDGDVNYGKYTEYVADRIEADCITAIYIPELFRNRVNLPESVLLKVIWCEMQAEHYGEEGKECCPSEIMARFAETAEIMDSSQYNFFRGIAEDRSIIDLYNIRYVI